MTTPAQLVDRYFEAASRHDADAIVNLFTADAFVVDEGKTRRGTAEIRDWQDHSASEYEYTTTVLARVPTGDSACSVTVRLEGNFPGGTADLSFDFLLADGLISGLTIAP
jgi:ketosteroid isomerase-like protein